jgi:hypothetical protein
MEVTGLVRRKSCRRAQRSGLSEAALLKLPAYNAQGNRRAG